MVKYLITWNMQGATGKAKNGAITDKYALLENRMTVYKNFVCCLQECGWPKGTWKWHESHRTGINRIIDVYRNEHN